MITTLVCATFAPRFSQPVAVFAAAPGDLDWTGGDSALNFKLVREGRRRVWPACARANDFPSKKMAAAEGKERERKEKREEMPLKWR